MEIKRKCAVCIGCGRCGEYGKDLQVITDSFLKSELLSVDSADKGSFVIVDIGTTTIAMEVVDTQGKKQADYVQPNPQRVFGRDVISRIQAAEDPLIARPKSLWQGCDFEDSGSRRPFDRQADAGYGKTGITAGVGGVTGKGPGY